LFFLEVLFYENGAMEGEETDCYCVALRSIVIIVSLCMNLRYQPPYHANLQSVSHHDNAGCMRRAFDTLTLRAHPKIPCDCGTKEIYVSSGDVWLGAWRCVYIKYW